METGRKRFTGARRHDRGTCGERERKGASWTSTLKITDGRIKGREREREREMDPLSYELVITLPTPKVWFTSYSIHAS